MLTVVATYYNLNIYDCDAHEIIAFYSQLIQTRRTDSDVKLLDGAAANSQQRRGLGLRYLRHYEPSSRGAISQSPASSPAGLPRRPRRQHRVEPREAINTKKGSRLISGWTSPSNTGNDFLCRCRLLHSELVVNLVDIKLFDRTTFG